MTSGKLCILEPQFPHCKMGIIAPTLHIIRLGNIKYEAMHLAQNKLLINITIIISEKIGSMQSML